MQKRFAAAVSQFNAEFFFDCHDTLEEIWMDVPAAEKPFYQGLLHIAVGLYHFENENYKGALSQLSKAKTRLGQFLPKYHGVHLKELLNKTEPFYQAARQKTAGEITHFETPAFPKIIWEEEAF